MGNKQAQSEKKQNLELLKEHARSTVLHLTAAVQHMANGTYLLAMQEIQQTNQYGELVNRIIANSLHEALNYEELEEEEDETDS